MKLMHAAIIFAIAAVLFSCGEKKENTTVNIGMTYEEVEAVLGKPASIIRGMNELADITTIPEDPLRVINIDTIDTKNEVNRWMAPKEVKTSKEELYTTWVYNEEKTEDFYVLYDNYKEGQTITKKVPVYYLGDKKVSKEEYDAATGSLYIEPGAGKQQTTKTSGKTKVPIDSLKLKQPKMKEPMTKGKMIEKRIEYVTKTVGKSEAVVESVDKLNYKVDYKLCVVFDSASGRVVQHDYFPFSVKEYSSNTE
jgi:hypothetical protein